MQPPMPPTSSLPGSVIMNGVEADTFVEVPVDAAMYREFTVHISNKDSATGFATIDVKANFYGDEWEHLDIRNPGSTPNETAEPLKYHTQHNVNTKNNNPCQHFTGAIPPGTKKLGVNLANRTTGKFTVTISLR